MEMKLLLFPEWGNHYKSIRFSIPEIQYKIATQPNDYYVQCNTQSNTNEKHFLNYYLFNI